MYSISRLCFSIDLKDIYLQIAIVKHHHHFLHFGRQHTPYQWKVLPFGLAMAPRIFISLTKLMLFLCHHNGVHDVVYLDDILVLTFSKSGKRAHTFLYSLLVHSGLYINFSKSELKLTQKCSFLPCVGIQWACLSLCHQTNLLRSSS